MLGEALSNKTPTGDLLEDTFLNRGGVEFKQMDVTDISIERSRVVKHGTQINKPHAFVLPEAVLNPSDKLICS